MVFPKPLKAQAWILLNKLALLAFPKVVIKARKDSRTPSRSEGGSIERETGGLPANGRRQISQHLDGAGWGQEAMTISIALPPAGTAGYRGLRCLAGSELESTATPVACRLVAAQGAFSGRCHTNELTWLRAAGNQKLI